MTAANNTLFKAIEVIFPDNFIDNTVHIQRLKGLGAPASVMPERYENRMVTLDDTVSGLMSARNMRWEREFTRTENGRVYVYIAYKNLKSTTAIRQALSRLIEDGTISSFSTGVMTDAAKFVAK